MMINGLNGVYDRNSGIKRPELPQVLPFSVPFNSIFDEFVSIKDKMPLEGITEAEDDKIKVIAHRGYTEKAPENTIPAFIAAAENGYNTVECDVEWTKDNVPVILHDSTINRTARRENGWRLFWPRKCSNLTYEELLKYDFGSWYSKDFKGTKIPTFNEVLDCANDYDLNLYVELKDTSGFDDKKVQTLTDAVKEAGLEDKITWISFNSDYLKAISEAMSNARLGYLTKYGVDEDTIDTLKSLKNNGNEVFLDIKAAKISDESSKMLKEAGFDFELWTVDDSDELKDLSAYDFSGITTNKLTEDDIEEYCNP